jgi:putative hydrolase of the HAD superfamily
MMGRNIVCIVFDYDGVLVDSYSCLPKIYGVIADRLGVDRELFIEKALEYEDIEDYKGNYDRGSWWKKLFGEFNVSLDIDPLLELYWSLRMELSTVYGYVWDVLASLRSGGYHLFIVAGGDGVPSMKRRRIVFSGLDKYFDGILIEGEDIGGKVDGIKVIMDRFGFEEGSIMYIDDKPKPINMVKSMYPDIFTVRIDYRGPLSLAWEGECRSDIILSGIDGLLQLLSG